MAVAGCAGTAANATGDTAQSAATSRELPRPFTIAARYTAKSLGLEHPDALAIGPDGNVYVTDASQRVTVISPDGKVVRRWGKPGSGPGEFNFISADAHVPTAIQGQIAVGADGNVYVSDSGNSRVQVFTPEGQFVRQLGSLGSGKGQFLRPFHLAVDTTGDVYVADDQAATLSKFSAAGKVLWKIGAVSNDPDLFGHFMFNDFDVHGRLVAMNGNQDKVLYIDASGRRVDAFTPSRAGYSGGNACDAAVDAAGNTYVSGCGDGPLPTGNTLVYDRTHRLIARWPGTPYNLMWSPAFGPHGEAFAVATDGTILRLRITLPGA